jgi:hypothetical protein
MELLQNTSVDPVIFGLTEIMSVPILRSLSRAIFPQQVSPLAYAKCPGHSVPGFSASQDLPQRSPFMLQTARFLSICVWLVIAVVALPIRGAARPKAEPSSPDDRSFQTGSSNMVTADPLVPRPHEKPCVVQLFSNFQFVNFNIHAISSPRQPIVPVRGRR